MSRIKVLILFCVLSLAVNATDDKTITIVPLQEQLFEELEHQCKKDMEYWKKKVEEHPNDPYFKFKLKKIIERCK